LINGEIELVSKPYTVEMVTSTGEVKYFNLMDSIGLNNTLITAGTEITQQILSQRELKVVSDKLAQALEAEKQLNELKTRFISMVSHEFRTPLTVIMSCTTVIRQAIEKLRRNVAEEYLEKIVKSVKTMNELMEDVLVIGKAELSQTNDIVKINLVDFLQNAIYEIQESYSFGCQADLQVKKYSDDFYSDEKLLKHIVYNLITNALKYTTNGQNAVITIDEVGSNVVFTVMDKGIGIPADDLNNLFSDFYRAKNVGNIPGTGLGLHIVKKSVENLLGTIEVQSVVNEGTTFTVILPK
jgi:signal transduction histidine kinase